MHEHEVNSGKTWHWRGAGLLLLVATRVAVVLAPGLHRVTTDTARYFRHASALLDGRLIEFFPNGFPAIIAGVWAIVGEGAVAPLVWLNVCFSVGVVLFTYALAREWFDSREARAWGPALAFLAIVFWPNHLRFVPRLLSDIPATFFLMGGLWAAVRRHANTSGVLLGIAVTIRTTIAPVWLGAVAWLFARGRRDEGWRCLGAGLVPISLLVSYGYLQTGTISLGGNLRYNLLKAVYDSKWGIGFEASSHDIPGTMDAIGAYLSYAVSRPFEFISQRFYALWQLWGPWPMGGFSSAYSRFAVALRFPLVVLAGVGFWRRKSEWLTWLLALPFVVVTIIHTIFFGLARFAIPAEPALAILAAEGLIFSVGGFTPLLSEGKRNDSTDAPD